MKPGLDRHAIMLRDLALRIVQAHGASYRDDRLVSSAEISRTVHGGTFQSGT